MIATTFDTVAAQAIPSSLKAWTAGGGSRVRSAMIGGPAAADKGDR